MEPTRIHGLEIAEGVMIEGRYEIHRKLGAGGFAQVFAAHDTNVEREVAIKFLDVHTGNRPPDQIENILARFKREAKVAAQLGHPNVVNIFDFGVLQARGPVPYIVMEYLVGHDLETQLQQHGPLGARRAVELFIPCLEGLGEAHKLGIIHKDLKPANLFLVKPGERGETLRLVDFGVAHFDADPMAARLTATGEILGTPQYLPPEYINKQVVSPAFDVYQMGLILVELLSGTTVVNEANPFRCIMRHGQGDLDIPAPWLDTVLGPIITKSLALEHTDRYEDGYAMADAMAAIDLKALPTPEEIAKWKASGGTKNLRSSSEMLAAGRLTGVATDALIDPNSASIGFDNTVEASSSMEFATQRGFVPQGQAPVAQNPAPPPPGSVPLWNETRSLAYGASDPVPRQHQRTIAAGGGEFVKPASGEKKVLMGFVIGVVIVTVIIAFLLTRGDEVPTPGNEPIAVEQPTEPAEPQEPVVTAPDRAPEKEDKPAEPVMVRLEVEPNSAQILANNMALGRSPATIQYAGPDDEPINFEIRAEGYETLKFEMGPDAGPVRKVVLSEIAKPKVEPKTVVRPPREKTPTKKTEPIPPAQDQREFLVVP